MIFNLLLLLAFLRASLATDATLTPGSQGADVVEATCSKIESACIFPDDKMFTRRQAYVESYDGSDPKTYRAGYYGGVWQVDQVMFDLTQSSSAQTYLSNYITGIEKNFQIKWSTVLWTDLTKPFYSALASRLYIQYQSRYEQGGIPRSVEDQSLFWVKFYRPTSDPNEFVTKANTLEKSCISNGADIIFLFDGSGSITPPNFELMKGFAKDVVSSYDVGSGSNQARFGLIQYGTVVKREFDLNTYWTAAAINSAIDRVQYMAGNTYTNLGLDEMRNNGYLESNGARPTSQNHPRVGIVLTDGASNNPSLTAQSANLTQSAGIHLIAVGIGSSVNMNELKAIASDPDCLNLIMSTFSEMDSLHYIIDQRTCDAPIDIKPGDDSTIELPSEGDQNCKLDVPKEGVTVEMTSLNEATVKFFVSRAAYPSPSYYDEMVQAGPNHMGLLYVANSNADGNLESIFCNIKAGNVSANISIGAKPGNGDTCQLKTPCENGAVCENVQGGDYKCVCPEGFTGKNCESKSVTEVISSAYNCNDRNPCTAANIENGDLYFPNDDPAKFIQCSTWGQCYVMSCPAGTVWDQAKLTCDYAL